MKKILFLLVFSMIGVIAQDKSYMSLLKTTMIATQDLKKCTESMTQLASVALSKNGNKTHYTASGSYACTWDGSIVVFETTVLLFADEVAKIEKDEKVNFQTALNLAHSRFIDNALVDTFKQTASLSEKMENESKSMPDMKIVYPEIFLNQKGNLQFK